MEILFIVWAWAMVLLEAKSQSGKGKTVESPPIGFFRHFVEEKVWPVVLACYLVVGVDNKAFVDRGREAWLLINGGGN